MKNARRVLIGFFTLSAMGLILIALSFKGAEPTEPTPTATEKPPDMVATAMVETLRVESEGLSSPDLCPEEGWEEWEVSSSREVLVTEGAIELKLELVVHGKAKILMTFPDGKVIEEEFDRGTHNLSPELQIAVKYTVVCLKEVE